MRSVTHPIILTQSPPPYKFTAATSGSDFSISLTPFPISCSLRFRGSEFQSLVFCEQEYFKRMEHNETGCQAPPEAPKLCANNCGFFGSAATMNLCSKCHKDLVLKQEQAKVAAVSIESAVNATPNNWGKKPAVTLDVQAGSPDLPLISTEASSTPPPNNEEKVKETPTRCNTCRKRVGLTGFNCRCGHLFCAVHRYSDKHDCQYDYRAAAQDAIAKANPVVKAEKLDKI